MFLPSPAFADCGSPNVFGLAERAARVVAVDVAAGTTGRVIESWKGEGAAVLTFPTAVPEDGFVPRPGHRYVLFLGRGDRVETCDRALDLALDRALAEAVRDWLVTPDGAARTGLLVSWGTGADEALADEALAWLGQRPDHLAALGPAQRAALVAQVPAAEGPRSAGLAWTLARLHAVEAVPAWVEWLGRPHPGASSRPVLEALQLSTLHVAPGSVAGRDVSGDELARIREDFAAWWRTWAGRPVGEALAAGEAERPTGDPWVVVDRRNRCELAARLPRTALPAAGATGAVDPACP